MTYEIWFNDCNPIQDETRTIMTFSSKKAAKTWITENIDQAFLRRKYRIKEAL